MSEYILSRIHAIQQELEELKMVVAHQMKGPKRKIRLKGLWEGIQVTEKDLQAAQKAIFRNAYKFEE